MRELLIMSMFVAIVPAYNEEKRIADVVRKLQPHVDRVVVVDDGSVDQTSREASDAGAVVLRHQLNRGQGAALETGHEYARQAGAEMVLHFDGDGQFDVADIASAVAALRAAQADVLFGSRMMDERSNTPFLKRAIIFPLARLFHRVAYGIRLTDVHNGFRILTGQALQDIRITQDGMAHATEIPALTYRSGLQFVEFPVKVTYHEYGQPGMNGFRILYDLFLGKFIR